jgi:hypothetical protein
MSMLGARWRKAKAEKQGGFGKESMHEESDSWKEEQHARMQGRPNDIRARVLVMYCNGRRDENV